jgi:hypothetical protein
VGFGDGWNRTPLSQCGGDEHHDTQDYRNDDECQYHSNQTTVAHGDIHATGKWLLLTCHSEKGLLRFVREIAAAGEANGADKKGPPGQDGPRRE